MMFKLPELHLVSENQITVPANFEKSTDSLFWIDLQWFAAEDEGRTEKPTDQKIRKSREEGKVAKSQEVSGAIVLLLSIVGIAIFAGNMFTGMQDMMRFFFNRVMEIDIREESSLYPIFLQYFLRFVGPIAAIAFFASILGNVVQFGFLFSTKPLKPDLKRIVPNFPKYFKRAFGSPETLFNLAKSILKIVIIGFVAYLNILARMPDALNYFNAPLANNIRLVSITAFSIFVQVAGILLLLSLFDYLFQRKQHLESLKMSKQEIKEERKQSDGDPLVKRRLQERMREILNRNMLKNVPDADVIVTNPTHFAVALEYKRESMDAPRVVAKGSDNMAFKIREIAKENDVPIIENKPLARALFAELEVGDSIPEQFYEVMAVILRQVYEMRGETVLAG
jgi:flagellar biosynthetic protein FlhB